MIKEFFGYYSSPIGTIKITALKKGVTSISFVEIKNFENSSLNNHIIDCIEQLDEYFRPDKLRRKKFRLKLDIQGSIFQKKVWQQMRKIPFGKTVTYSELAEKIGNKNASRAIGLTCKLNKIPIIIPCHRVIGKNNKLVGFDAGLWRKEWLLRHEGSILL